MARAIFRSLQKPTVEVKSTTNSSSCAISTTCAGVMPCGGPSRRRLPSSMPAGYVSHTGYQYDSISRVAGQREPAPPSNFSKLGGFNNNVFITDAMYYYPPQSIQKRHINCCLAYNNQFYSISALSPSHAFLATCY